MSNVANASLQSGILIVGEATHVGQVLYKKSLYLPFIFAVNLKLL